MKEGTLSTTTAKVRTVFRRGPVAMVFVAAWLLATSALVAGTPRSLILFLLFMASMLFIYYLDLPRWYRMAAATVALGLLMPYLGTHNGFYLEVATQVGIFVALALGLNIVVGLAGLLDLGYVAFYAVGAYSWAIFASPQILKAAPGLAALFPLGGWWFFVFLLVGVLVAAVTGILQIGRA